MRSRVDQAIQQVHNGRMAARDDATYIPGEFEAENAARYAETGIPLNPVTLGDMRAAASEPGVDTDSHDWPSQ